MGVRGLKSFVESNTDLRQQHRLHDTRLVIDGCNLQFVLYWRSSQSNRDYIFGGDYVRYAAVCRQFFTSLAKCNVTPIVVFDGSRLAPAKFKTVLSRIHDRFACVRRISQRESFGERVLPPLARQVLVTVLDELQVEYVQAAAEADLHLAVIANRINCPVLSDDSDFFVFDLRAGLITINSIDPTWNVHTVTGDGENRRQPVYKYIDCLIYHIDRLVEYFPGLDKNLLPIFSSLVGNDYVGTKIFDKTMNAIPSSAVAMKRSAKSSSTIRVRQKHQQIFRLLNWMRDKNADEVIRFLIQFLKTDERKNAMKLIELTVDSYASNERRSELFKYLSVADDNSNEERFDMLVATRGDEITILDGKQLPVWFVDEYHQGKLAHWFLDVIKSRTMLLNPEINDFSLTSSNRCSLRLRRVLYGLLQLGDEEDLKKITEYDRKASNYGKIAVEPTLEVNGKKLPNLKQIRTLTMRQRQALMFDILKTNQNFFDDLKQLLSPLTKNSSGLDALQFLIVSIRYWISEADVPIWLELIYAFVIDIMFCGYIDTSVKIKYISIEAKEAQTAVSQLEKYWTQPVLSRKQPFESRVVHFYSQLQACLKFIIQTNALLGRPIEVAGSPFYCFNGNFVYNLTVELLQRKQPLLYLFILTGRDTPANDVIKKLSDILLLGFEDKVIRGDETGNHLKKVNAKRKAKLVDNVENRFAALAVE